MSVFVEVAGQGFKLKGRPYRFAGVNYWQAMHLGASDPSRLCRELDQLHGHGLDNVRVMAAFDGPDDAPFRVSPSLRPQPEVWNEALLQGLDRLMVELAARNMRAVVVLSNFWFWSGGLAQYESWASKEPIPYPIDHTLEAPDMAWQDFARFAARGFAHRKLWASQIERIVCRKNHHSDQAYRDDPTIMAWQLANEPRGADRREQLIGWRSEAAALIRALDSNHLISLGSEGSTADPEAAGLSFEHDHDDPNIDYATIHIWPQNWGWYQPSTEGDPAARALAYLRDHAARSSKPLVLEETGLARDGGGLSPSASVIKRNAYFEAIVTEARSLGLAGLNAWSYSGEGRPSARMWKPGAPLTGDPPHEPQGWYSIYDSDESTLEILAGF